MLVYQSDSQSFGNEPDHNLMINSLISICHTRLVGSDQACEPSEYNVMYKYLERRVAFHPSNALTV